MWNLFANQLEPSSPTILNVVRASQLRLASCTALLHAGERVRSILLTFYSPASTLRFQSVVMDAKCLSKILIVDGNAASTFYLDLLMLSHAKFDGSL